MNLLEANKKETPNFSITRNLNYHHDHTPLGDWGEGMVKSKDISVEIHYTLYLDGKKKKGKRRKRG